LTYAKKKATEISSRDTFPQGKLITMTTPLSPENGFKQKKAPDLKRRIPSALNQAPLLV